MLNIVERTDHEADLASHDRASASPLPGAWLIAFAIASTAHAGVDFGVPLAISPGNLNPTSYIVGDLDSDGHLDVVYGGSQITGQVPIRSLMGTGTGAYTNVMAGITAGLFFPLQALADFQGDGKLDLVARNFAVDALSVRMGVGDGTFSAGITLGPVFDPDLQWFEHARPMTLLPGALPDLVYCSRGNAASGIPGRLRVLRNTGAGFTFVESQDIPVGVSGMHVADFNDDGLDDVVTQFQNGSQLVFVSDGTGGLDLKGSVTGGFGTLVSADIDADGHLDLIMPGSSFLGAGDGTLGPANPLPAAGGWIGLAIADADGDGAPDLVANRYVDGSGLPPLHKTVIEVCRGFCDGTFATPVALTDASKRFAGPVVADLDEDGMDDIVVIPDGEFISVMYNKAPAPIYADLGGGIAGTPIGGSTASSVDARGALISGEPFCWTLVDAKPSAPAYFILGASSISAPFLGGTLVPAPSIVFGGLQVGADGRLPVGGTVPTISGGFDVYFQFWYLDSGAPFGVAASPGLVGSVP